MGNQPIIAPNGEPTNNPQIGLDMTVSSVQKSKEKQNYSMVKSLLTVAAMILPV